MSENNWIVSFEGHLILSDWIDEDEVMDFARKILRNIKNKFSSISYLHITGYD